MEKEQNKIAEKNEIENNELDEIQGGESTELSSTKEKLLCKTLTGKTITLE